MTSFFIAQRTLACAGGVCVCLTVSEQARPEHGMTKASYIDAVLKGIAESEPHLALALTQHHQQDQHLQQPAGGVNNNNNDGQAGSQAGAGGRSMLVKVLLSIDRREGAAAAMETVQLAAALMDRGVVGVDLSGK